MRNDFLKSWIVTERTMTGEIWRQYEAKGYTREFVRKHIDYSNSHTLTIAPNNKVNREQAKERLKFLREIIDENEREAKIFNFIRNCHKKYRINEHNHKEFIKELKEQKELNISLDDLYSYYETHRDLPSS